jgi:hypothetical protein
MSHSIKHLLFLAFLLSGFLIAGNANAQVSVLYTQTISDTESTTNPARNIIQTGTTGIPRGGYQALGTGLSGDVASVSFFLSATPGALGNQTIRAGIACYTIASLSFDTGSPTCGFSETSDKTLLTTDTAKRLFDGLLTITFNPANYYYFYIRCISGCQGGTNITPHIWGENSFSFALGQLHQYGFGLQAMAFAIYGTTADPTYTSTQIIRQNSPTPGSIQTSTSVVFDFDFYFVATASADNFTTAGVQIENIITGLSYAPPEKAILAEGEINFNSTKTVAAGDLHRWRPYLRNNDGDFLYGNWENFDVVNRDGYFSSMSPTASDSANSLSAADDFCSLLFPGDAIISDIGRILCMIPSIFLIPSMDSLVSIVNIPQNNGDKFPFVYFYEIKGIMEDEQLEDEGNFPTLNLTADINGASVSFDMISMAQVEEYTGDGFLEFARTGIVFVMWISFAMMIVHRVRNAL